MNKPALKRFATEARRELLERVELQARKIGITSDGVQKATIESSDAIFINGRQLKEKEKVQRNKLIARIREIGFERVIEEVSYTWFNRFTALRFMEVNDYLPTKVRVLSSTSPGSSEPDMMKDALTLDLELDKEYIYELKLNNNDDELFKYLIIKHCNDLNRYMPFMFETIDHYTEILFPEGLLSVESFIQKMIDIESIPESDWEKIEVIGWLYQYYIAEEKDRVFKAKKKYKAEEIPFATQLFTPDWIVQYMVQNSLGRYWVEANPNHKDLIDNWHFYLQNTEEGFEKNIAPYINKELKVEEIKCFDPAMGSGHILVYMFDVLYEIYSKSGYMEREIPRLIIENNLYGLDIDDRAYQLASFSIVMKAVEYNNRFLRSIEREELTLNLASIQETNTFTEEDVQYLANGDKESLEEIRVFIKQFKDAKTIGSLIKVFKNDTRYLEQRLKFIRTAPVKDIFEVEQHDKALTLLPQLIKQTKIMSLEYDALVTNPPYMGSRSMNKELTNYLEINYPDSKADLFAAFMEVDHFIKQNGFFASINQHSWMFLSSFEKLRIKLIEGKNIESMLHLGSRAFEEISGEVVQTTTFVMRNSTTQASEGIFVRLVDERITKEKREKAIIAAKNPLVAYRYSFNQNNFSDIPGSPFSYWLSKSLIEAFRNSLLYDYSISDGQNVTGNNEKYVRYHWEVENEKIGTNNKWVYYAKGGGYRRWAGSIDSVIDWSIEARKFYRENNSSRIIPNYLWFKKGITWGLITSNLPSFRVLPEDSTFDKGGSSVFIKEDKYFNYVLGLLNSKIFLTISKALNPTLNFQVRDVRSIPIIKPDEDSLILIDSLVKENIFMANQDWNTFETSPHFKSNFLLNNKSRNCLIEESYNEWIKFKSAELLRIEYNEEKLNNVLIDIYELNNELTSKVDTEDVTLSRVNLERDIKGFISYSLGCSFGRYSLIQEGLVFAGGLFNTTLYNPEIIDSDNIIPLLSEPYFEDDIVTRIINFIRFTYGKENLEQNLNFVTNAIGRKKNETAREALRNYFLNDFYKDHVQVYKKRPIYWLFTSGKEKAFNCLIYLHRYDKTTLSRIRIDYLHEVQIRMDAEKKDLLNIIEGDSSTKEISNAKKELKSLDKKIDELKAYDEKLHHMADMQIEIDLDDGVAVNYAKFEGLVAKI